MKIIVVTDTKNKMLVVNTDLISSVEYNKVAKKTALKMNNGDYHLIEESLSEIKSLLEDYTIKKEGFSWSWNIIYTGVMIYAIGIALIVLYNIFLGH